MSTAETNETLGRLDVRAPAIAYPPAQAAIVSGRTRTRIFGAIKSGELKARKDGKATIIEHEELIRWIKSFPLAQREPSQTSVPSRNLTA
ncbi:MAG: DNA-binding protein [Xanthobacteraceae bacterium]|jgi:hypothetical protein